MRRFVAVLGIGSIALAAACADQGSVLAPDGAAFNHIARSVHYAGQGFEDDGTLKDFRCDASANDGGTGQGVEPGETYLLWVLTVNGATSAKLYLPGGLVGDMIKVGGTFKFKSDYFSPDQLADVYATYEGTARGNVQLTVSHGCQPRTGGWCSPGFWKNAKDAAWALTGFAKNDLFNSTVVPNFYATVSAANPTLIQVLTTPGANTFGGPDDPFGLNAFNAVGAFLTDQLDGGFDPSQVGLAGSCQIDHHGNYKPDSSGGED